MKHSTVTIITAGFALLLGISASAQVRKVIDIPVPRGYERTQETGFGEYLRELPLKKDGTKVRLYDGAEKSWQGGAYAVIDMEIGTSDLQQCADAVIRLRAEYLYKNRMYEDIHFNFTNGFRADYTKWADGYRIKVSGNNVRWYKACEPDFSYKTFRKYLDMVFSYAGTASLSKELASVRITDIRIGDVFIQGGFPGHAMIVVDIAESEDGDKAILVAQSYMPAQDIHIVTNPEGPSPWYIISDTTEDILFPEWHFTSKDLKRFR